MPETSFFRKTFPGTTEEIGERGAGRVFFYREKEPEALFFWGR